MSAIRRLVATAVASALITGAWPAAHAQAPGPRPGWLPREVNTSRPGVGAAGVRIAMSRLEQLEQVFLQIPEIAQPKGFEIFARYTVGGRILHPDDKPREGDVVGYRIQLMFAFPTWAIAGEGRDCISVMVNRPLTGDEGSWWEDAENRRIYTDQPRGKPMPLATQVYGAFNESPEDQSWLNVLFTSGGELPYRNITRDEYYASSLSWDETGLGMRRGEDRQAAQRSPYQEWLAGAAQRKQERDELFRNLAGSVSAAELAQMRKLAEDQERDIGESLKNAEPDDQTGSSAYAEGLRAERARQTPAQLRLPALFGGDDDRLGASGRNLTDRDGPGVLRVLTPNYDFWRARRSPVEVRSIEVKLLGTGTCSAPDVKKALFAASQKVDWAAFHRMLDVPQAP